MNPNHLKNKKGSSNLVGDSLVLRNNELREALNNLLAKYDIINMQQFVEKECFVKDKLECYLEEIRGISIKLLKTDFIQVMNKKIEINLSKKISFLAPAVFSLKKILEKKKLDKSVSEKAIFEEIIISCIKILLTMERYDEAMVLFNGLKNLEILKREKNVLILDFYRIGSSFKKQKDYLRSILWFKKILCMKPENEMKSGIFFHLGENNLYLKNDNRAKIYFKKCIRLNNSHRMAQNFLSSLSC